jgi:uncharacterized membrane protein
LSWQVIIDGLKMFYGFVALLTLLLLVTTDEAIASIVAIFLLLIKNFFLERKFNKLSEKLHQHLSRQVPENKAQQESHKLYQGDAPEKPNAAATPAHQAPASKPRGTTLLTPKPKAAAQTRERAPKQQSLIIATAYQKLMHFLTTGNALVKIGAIVLLFGLGFALHYAEQNNYVSLSTRFILIGGVGIILLFLGWQWRQKYQAYAMVLQGTGLGVMYLTIVMAYRLYHLLSPEVAFAVLVIFTVFGLLLALLQDSCSLAVMALFSGFLAPIMASSGSNNYIGLFSYYAILNVALLTVAWWRQWRILNLLGFLFTFVIAGLWGFYGYSAKDYPTIQSFLIGFYLIYLALPIIYAERFNIKLLSYLDTPLLFALPLLGFSYQCYLVHYIQYGAAISAVTLALLYSGLAKLCWQRDAAKYRLLAETYIALALIFITLSLPLMASNSWIAAIWALEASCLIWYGRRTARLITQVFGVILLCLAQLLYFIEVIIHFTSHALISPAFITAMLISLAILASSYMLRYQKALQSRLLQFVSYIVFIIGMIWLYCTGFAQVTRVFYKFQAALIKLAWLFGAVSTVSIHLSLLYITLCSLLLCVIGRRLMWQEALYAVHGLLLLMVFFAIGLFVQGTAPVLWIWLLAAAVAALCLYQNEKSIKLNLAWLHITFTVVLIFIPSFWLATIANNHVAYASSWVYASWAFPAIVVSVLLLLKGSQQRFPMLYYRTTYQHHLPDMLLAYLLLWLLFANLLSSGNVGPISYVPVLNPLDILSLLILLLCYLRSVVVSTTKNIKLPVTSLRNYHLVLGLMSFYWLNTFLIHSIHQYAQIPYRISALWDSYLIQASLSIYWTVLGLMLAKFASLKGHKILWKIAAALIALVVIKLFTVDLTGIQTLWRIISFVGVGGLLLAVGYFAPMPTQNKS